MMIDVDRKPGRIRRSVHLLALLGALALSMGAAGMEPGPFAQNLFDSVLQALEDSRDGVSPNGARRVIEDRLGHHIAVETIARSVLRGNWAGSSEDEQLELLYALRGSLLDSLALMLGNGGAVEFDLNGAAGADRGMADVAGRLTVDGVNRPLELRLIRMGKAWRIFDVTCAGVSLTDSFRSEFAGLVETGGINAVTEALNQRRLAAVSVATPAP